MASPETLDAVGEFPLGRLVDARHHPRLARLFAYVEASHPRSRRGIHEARAVAPHRFDAIAEMYLGWAVRARGDDAIPACADAFARFCMDVNLAQARYEQAGHYAHKTYAQCREEVYAHDSMADYLWGVYLTNFLWAHHFEIGLTFHDRFLRKLEDDVALVELAPGHGGWGLWALRELPGATLRGYDISRSSIAIASSLAEAAGLGGRATYEERNALALGDEASGSADAVICCFLVEHLEDPALLFATIAKLLRPRGLAFVTGALTAAQVDHIFEFRRESELALLAEAAGMRVLETLSGAPVRTLRGARFLPRSIAMIVQKRAGEIW